ncbi:hypothetical protein Tco_1568201 [Tanacetum coccineum]
MDLMSLYQLAINSGVVSPLATRKVYVHAINGFDMPLPVAVCSGLVNPLAPRKVNSLVQKIDSQASDLKAHKLVFKEVVGKLVKKVKELEDKLKGRKRKLVMTESDIEEEEEQDVVSSIKLPRQLYLLLAIPPNVTTGPTDAPSDKGKTPMLEEEPPRGWDMLLFAEKENKVAAQIVVLSISDDQLKDEFDKIRHVVANLQSQYLRRSLKRQGADLEQPNLKKSKSTEPQRTFVPAASRPSSAGVTLDVHQSPFVDTLPATPPHSPKASSHPDVTPDTSKQPSVAPIPPSGFSATHTVTRTSGPRTRNQSSAAGIKTYSTRRKSLGSRKMSSSEVDLSAADSQPPSVEVGTRRKQFGRKGVHPSRSTIPIEDEDPDAEHKMCIKYASDIDLDSDDDTLVNLHGVVDWELLPTGLGWVNVIYRKDNSCKCLSRLREILHLVTRTDLMIIYGRVMQFYQDTEAAGVGLVLWGDLKVLIDSPEVNDGSDVWKNQNTWIIPSWKLYSSTGIHVLETEICRDTVGNELTTTVQLITFLKKQLFDSRRPKLFVNVVFLSLGTS